MDAASHSIFEGSPENEKEIMMTMMITDQLSSCYFSSYYVARPLRSPFPPSVSPLCAQASGGRVHERHHHQGEVEEVEVVDHVLARVALRYDRDTALRRPFERHLCARRAAAKHCFCVFRLTVFFTCIPCT